MRSAHFTITGEFLTGHARDMVLSDQPAKAWRLLADTLVGDGVETAVRTILDGTMDLVGDSSSGIGVAVAEDTSKYQETIDYIYAGRWRSSKGWCRPCAKIERWGSASGRSAARQLNRHEINEAPNGARREWSRARAAFYCGKHEFAEIVMIDGQWTYVIFEFCGEPPFWLAEHNLSAQAAVDDAARAGRRLDSRGDRVQSIRSFTETMIEADDLDLQDGEDSVAELRALAKQAEAEEEDEANAAADQAFEERLRQIGEAVRAQASGDTFDLTLLDGRVATVPRAPFVCWAVMRTDPEAAPPWKPVSPPGLKLPNDDPYHSDWMLGADIDLSESYRENVNRPAWDAAARFQENLRGCHALDSSADLGEDVPTGILAALNSLRRASVRATVIVDAGRVEGIIGGDIVVLPDLSPLQVPLIVKARAVIAETGGPASHLAIVARGHALTVLRVPDAMLAFQPGTRVVVDPKARTVTVLDDDDA